jgi:predicted DNA-binding protein
MAREDPQMKLRVPTELKARVEEAAQHAGRSLNAEIVHRLERSFVVDEQLAIPLLETLADAIEKIISDRAGSKEVAKEQMKRATAIQDAAEGREKAVRDGDGSDLS